MILFLAGDGEHFFLCHRIYIMIAERMVEGPVLLPDDAVDFLKLVWKAEISEVTDRNMKVSLDIQKEIHECFIESCTRFLQSQDLFIDCRVMQISNHCNFHFICSLRMYCLSLRTVRAEY
ncbi:Uncharacterised protein [Mycobacteroides abscessus subsp. abscessus]|nr:Uncharacterised protein [Mycobacteroides abscessus subsp. abscessus]